MSSQSKKNLQGGKAHKAQAHKERSGPKKNRELVVSYIEDLEAENIPGEIVIARVSRLLGGGRMDLVTITGTACQAALKGSLKCGKGGRKSDNPIAVFPGTYVLVNEEAYGSQITAVLSWANVKSIQPYGSKIVTALRPDEKSPSIPRGFFDMTASAGEEDLGIDWDVDEAPVDIDAI